MVCAEEGFILYAEQHLMNDDSNVFFFLMIPPTLIKNRYSKVSHNKI